MPSELRVRTAAKGDSEKLSAQVVLSTKLVARRLKCHRAPCA